jgi:Domain of unknown function (DUF4279)
MSEPEISIRLELRSDEIDPDRITEALGLQPSETWRRGDAWGRRPRPHPEHGWVLATPYRATWDPDEPLRQLLEWIEPSKASLIELTAGGLVEGRLSIVGSQRDRGPSIYLDSEVVRVIAQLGLDLNVDFYVVEDVPDGEEEESR